MNDHRAIPHGYWLIMNQTINLRKTNSSCLHGLFNSILKVNCLFTVFNKLVSDPHSVYTCLCIYTHTCMRETMPLGSWVQWPKFFY